MSIEQESSRHGKLKEGRKQTSITLDEELLNTIKSLARDDNRSVSNWIENSLKRSVEEEKDSKNPIDS